MKNCFQNWSDVRVFLAVLRAGSTLGASKELGMAQPTVARRIEALEHSLGIILFERDTRGFRPTGEAQSLIESAEAVETAMYDFSDNVQRLKSNKAGVISIAAPTENFSQALSDILAEFSNQHPGTRFEFMPGNKTIDILAGEADIAIRLAPSIDEPDLICRKLMDVQSTCYATPEYVKKFTLPILERDLKEHAFIVYEGEYIPRRINNWLLDRITPDQIVMKCADVQSMVSALRMGIGIGPLATGMGDNIDTLVRCFDPPQGTSTPGWMLINPASYRRAEVKAFTTFFGPRYSSLIRETQLPNEFTDATSR